MRNIVLKIIYKLENYKISFFKWIIVFFSIAFLRNFLEGIFEFTHTIGTNESIKTSIIQMFLLFNLEWITLFLGLILIFYFTTYENIIRLLKITLFFYIWIIVVPFIDFFYYYPKGGVIGYTKDIKEYINALFYFFIFNKNLSIPIGIRIEVFVATILSFLYVYFKTNNLINSFLAFILVYIIAISSMAFPVFILLPVLFFQKDLLSSQFVKKFFFSIGLQHNFLLRVSFMIFLLLILFLIILFIIYNKKYFFVWIKSIFTNKYFYFLLLLTYAGIFYALKNSNVFLPVYNFFTNPFDFVFIFFFFINIIFVFTIYLCYKDNFFKKTFKKFYIPFLTIIYLLNFVAGILFSYPVFLFIILFNVFYVFYFFSPYNLEKIKILNIFSKSLFNTCFFIMGFSSIAGIKTPQYISFYAAVFVFLISILYEIFIEKNY